MTKTAGYFQYTQQDASFGEQINPLLSYSTTGEEHEESDLYFDFTDMILCYPNLFLNAFQIKAEGNFEYFIFDMAGNELEKGVGNRSALVGEMLQTGLYFIQIKSQSKSKIMKMTKN